MAFRNNIIFSYGNAIKRRRFSAICLILCGALQLPPTIGHADTLTDSSFPERKNSQPEAHEDNATTDENTAIDITVLENDTDADGDALTVIHAAAEHGTVTIVKNTSLHYKPDENFSGVDRIQYTIFDGRGSIAPELAAAAGIDVTALCAANPLCEKEQTEQVTLRLQINFANNDATVGENYYPEVEKLAALMAKAPDESVTIEGHTSSSGSESYNQQLSERRAKAVAKVLVERHGIDAQRVTAIGYGESRLLDPSNSPEADRKNRRIDAVFNSTFARKIAQTSGTAAALVHVEVKALNHPPVAMDDQATVEEGGEVAIGVLTNDHDDDGNTIVVVRSNAQHGNVTITEDGRILYKPGPDYFGDDAIHYSISDGQGGEASATVSVIVNHVVKPVLWYLWGDAGYARGESGKREINRQLGRAGVSATVTRLDNERGAWQLGAGYSFNSAWALELGYVDLGEVAVQLTGTTTSADQFYSQASRIHPQSATGWSVTGQYLRPMGADIDLLARVGFWFWQSSYTTYNNTKVGNDSADGVDLQYGLGARYAINEVIGTRIIWQRFHIDAEASNVLTLGLIYQFR